MGEKLEDGAMVGSREGSSVAFVVFTNLCCCVGAAVSIPIRPGFVDGESEGTKSVTLLPVTFATPTTSSVEFKLCNVSPEAVGTAVFLSN